VVHDVDSSLDSRTQATVAMRCSLNRNPLSCTFSTGAPGTSGGELGHFGNNRRAKFYELTAAGRERFREETDGWHRLATAMSAALAAQPEEL
jgi:hypothetical protein